VNYSKDLAVDTDHIRLNVAQDPSSLRWLWRVDEGHQWSEGIQDSFRAAKLKGMRAMRGRVNHRINAWAAIANEFDGEIDEHQRATV
jgi:hypothetical protein